MVKQLKNYHEPKQTKQQRDPKRTIKKMQNFGNF
jgi:hypothetical protein